MLNSGEAEILIQKRSKDLLWQKERLLNIAIGALPKKCKYVAWLDCDVIFENPHWEHLAAEKLEHVPLVQPYSSLINLEANGELPSDPHKHNRQPIGNPEVFATLPEHALQHQFNGKGAACGYAWAAQKELLQKHGLYDACIIGSGDRAIFCAATGRFADAAAYMRMNSRRYAHYLRWAEPFFEDVAGRIGWIDGRVLNMWHGTMQNRQYESRHVDLKRHEFVPDLDIQLEESGCWIWKSVKPDMQKLLKDYFFSRNEDMA
jgi:hypothetical protein